MARESGKRKPTPFRLQRLWLPNPHVIMSPPPLQVEVGDTHFLMRSPVHTFTIDACQTRSPDNQLSIISRSKPQAPQRLEILHSLKTQRESANKKNKAA